MKPLLFLSVRSFVNGVKRAFSSARRLIGLLMVVGYYLNFLYRGFAGDPDQSLPSAVGGPVLEFRPEVLEAGAFAVFAILTIPLLLSSFNPKGGFRPADVDVLFATPVDPKIVLYFRIFRDYIVTLFLPLFIAVLAGRSAGQGVFMLLRHFPEQGRMVTRLFPVAYLLLAMCWVSLGYAMSLFVNRSDRNQKLINRGLIIVFALAFGYIGFRLKTNLNWPTALALTQNVFLRTVFFSATAATAIIMAPFHGSFAEGLAGLCGMFAIITIGIRISLSQVGYLYDQAAAKGFQSQNMRTLQRQGDTYGMIAAQALEGKVRGGWLTRRVARWNLRGGSALLWKEMMLHGRTGLWQYGVFGPIILATVLMPVWVSAQGRHTTGSESVYFGFLGFGVFMLSMSNAQSGFIELLRRVDFQKPLPFSPMVTVYWEVAAKAVPTVIISAIAGIGVAIIDPRLWPCGLAGIAMAPSLSLVLAAVALLVMVLFPDVDDATQRGFRGLMMLIGIAISVAPGIGLAGVLLFAHVNSLIIGIPFVLINAGVAAGVSAIAGWLYSSYNPSE